MHAQVMHPIRYSSLLLFFSLLWRSTRAAENKGSIVKMSTEVAVVKQAQFDDPRRRFVTNEATGGVRSEERTAVGNLLSARSAPSAGSSSMVSASQHGKRTYLAIALWSAQSNPSDPLPWASTKPDRFTLILRSMGILQGPLGGQSFLWKDVWHLATAVGGRHANNRLLLSREYHL